MSKLQVSHESVVVDEAGEFWSLYRDAFSELDSQSPCRQSFRPEEFKGALSENRITKVVATWKLCLAGLGLFTYDLEQIPWISTAYFASQYPEQYVAGRIGYMQALAVSRSFAGQLVGVAIVRSALNTLPPGGICCFDYSELINAKMPSMLMMAGRGLINNVQVVERQAYAIAFSTKGIIA